MFSPKVKRTKRTRLFFISLLFDVLFRLPRRVYRRSNASTNIYLIHARHLRTTYPRANGTSVECCGAGEEEEEEEEGKKEEEEEGSEKRGGRWSGRGSDGSQRACDKDERGCSRRTFTKRTESLRHVGEPDTIIRAAGSVCYNVRSPERIHPFYYCRAPLERPPGDLPRLDYRLFKQLIIITRMQGRTEIVGGKDQIFLQKGKRTEKKIGKKRRVKFIKYISRGETFFSIAMACKEK